MSAVKADATRRVILAAFRQWEEHERFYVSFRELVAFCKGETAASETHLRKVLRSMVASGEILRAENGDDPERLDLPDGLALYHPAPRAIPAAPTLDAPPVVRSRLNIYRTGGALVTLCQACYEEWPDDEPMEWECSSPIGRCGECGKGA